MKREDIEASSIIEMTTSTQSIKNSILLPSLLILGCFVMIYLPNFFWLVNKWMEHESYYSHGFLVPFISLYLIWRKKDILKNIPIEGSKSGLWFIIGGIFIQVLSTLWRVNFTSSISIIILIFGLVLYVFGVRVFKEVSFPIFFLIFMVPLPLVAQTTVVFKMKLFATLCSVKILNLLGIVAIQEGSTIHFINDSLLVGNPCSGLRSLISMLAFGALVAYLFPLTFMRKIILFALSIPVALLMNICRIVLLGLVANKWNSEVATGTFHTVMGLVIFVLAILFFFFIGKILQVTSIKNEK